MEQFNAITFDENGMMVNEDQEPIPLPTRKNRAQTAEPTETSANDETLDVINAKLDALLKVQGISPQTIKINRG